MRDSSTAEALQRHLPKARIVKAFNLLAAPVLEAAAWSESPVQPNVFYVSDDVAAGQVTRGLIADAGFKPVKPGPLKGSRQLEQVGVLLHHVATMNMAGTPTWSGWVSR